MKHKVVVFDDLSLGLDENINPAAEFIGGSVLDPSRLSELFRAIGFDHAFHLAARSRVMLSQSDEDNSFHANVLSTNNVLCEARGPGVRHFIFSSSREVYGEPRRIPVFDLKAEYWDRLRKAMHAWAELCEEIDQPGTEGSKEGLEISTQLVITGEIVR